MTGTRALTLTQPWASLIAVGAKGLETRGWRTAHRGLLAIHAAKGFPADARSLCLPASGPLRSPFRAALQAAGYNPPVWDGRRYTTGDLPLGAVVATAELVVVMRTTDPRLRAKLSEQERAFGDFSPGRYAWVLGNVRPLPEPIPAKGALGLWQWHDAPAELAGRPVA
jgi:hypothetical protein